MKIKFATTQEESRFVRRLRLLHDDLNSYVGAAATLVAINEHAEDKSLLEKLKEHATPWNCVLGALQHQAVVSIGRIHDNTRGAYLKPLIESLRNAASPECKQSAIEFDAAATKHRPFIDAILRLRHSVFAHTTHEAPLIATYGFEGLTWAMFEVYWDDISLAVAGMERGIFDGAHFPAIDLGEFRIIREKTASWLQSLK